MYGGLAERAEAEIDVDRDVRDFLHGSPGMRKFHPETRARGSGGVRRYVARNREMAGVGHSRYFHGVGRRGFNFDLLRRDHVLPVGCAKIRVKEEEATVEIVARESEGQERKRTS
jgi:hypothetical protein